MCGAAEVPSGGQCILLAGVSGSGKSTLCREMEGFCLCVELDSLLAGAYAQLRMGSPHGDPFSYSKWSEFLDSPPGYSKAFRLFRRNLQDTVRHRPDCSLLIAGNHFVLRQVRALIRSVLIEIGRPVTAQLALDVPPEVVFRQRKQRGNGYDSKISLRDIELEIECLRATLSVDGFNMLEFHECRSLLAHSVGLQVAGAAKH